MSRFSSRDVEYMRQAIELAREGTGRTSPNPLVGAVIVKNGLIVGRGYHARAGEAHAEVLALNEAGGEAKGASMYVSLEPCSHYGRTPPCVEAILAAGIRRVFVAIKDPNPLVAGRGIALLKEGGIEVITGVLAEEATRLNEVFIKYITAGLPFVVLKTAMTLDGKIATATGESQWITGAKSRQKVHELRNTYDAILVGIGTVLADNPSLTCRAPDGNGRDPVRVVLDSRCRIPLDSVLLTQRSPAPTIVAVADDAPLERVKRAEDAGAVILKLGYASDGLHLEQLLRELAAREISSVLVEGGSRVAGSFLKKRLADKVFWFIAPKIIGGANSPGPIGGEGVAKLSEAPPVRIQEVVRFGEDLCVEGYLE